MNQEGQEIFDLKSLTKEEVAWLEEHFIDFAREQYLVRWDDMREATTLGGIIEIELKRDVGNKVKIRELTKNRKVACRSGLDNPSLIPCHRDRYPGSRNLYIKKREGINPLLFLLLILIDRSPAGNQRSSHLCSQERHQRDYQPCPGEPGGAHLVPYRPQSRQSPRSA